MNPTVNSPRKQVVEVEEEVIHQLMVVRIHGFVPAEAGKIVWNEVLDKVIRTGSNKLLIDAKDSKVIPIETQQWFRDYYFPSLERRLPKGRRLRVARVQPEDIFSVIQSEQLDKQLDQLQSVIEFQVFQTAKQARQWLLGE